jgi:hypothetical protein
LTINKLERSVIGAHLGGSSIFPKGVSEESVPLTGLIFDECIEDSYQILVGRLSVPIPSGIIS